VDILSQLPFLLMFMGSSRVALVQGSAPLIPRGTHSKAAVFIADPLKKIVVLSKTLRLCVYVFLFPCGLASVFLT